MGKTSQLISRHLDIQAYQKIVKLLMWKQTLQLHFTENKALKGQVVQMTIIG